MMEETDMDNFADRLKHEFEDRASDGDMDESQDWFVNDKPDLERAPSPVASERSEKDVPPASCSPNAAAVAVAPPTKEPSGKVLPAKRSNTAATSDDDPDECSHTEGRTSFLHHCPSTVGILVMELRTGEQITQKRYGSKFFRIYLPQVSETQTDFCLFARKRIDKHKIRFSLDESTMSKWNNPCYGGKVVMTPSPQARRFKVAVPLNANRIQFDIAQEARKQELIVKLNAQTKRFNLFRNRSSSDPKPETYRSLVQKFINPLADVRCLDSNNTLFRVEKEGEVGSEKYIVTYMRPFSLFVSCCIAVGLEAHLLE